MFRENTEGIYVGMGGQFKRGHAPDEVAINEDVNTRKGVERIIRAAFEHAKVNGKKKVCMADKSNAMRHAHELWHRVFFEVATEYGPTIEARHLYVDALCLLIIQDPSQFEVIVTNNLFGDIVTDLGAALQGGLGMAASANVHASDKERVAMFEPVHGSAPPLAGKDIANPFAALLTVGMMLTHLGFAGPGGGDRRSAPSPRPSTKARAPSTSAASSARRRPPPGCASASPPASSRPSPRIVAPSASWRRSVEAGVRRRRVA